MRGESDRKSVERSSQSHQQHEAKTPLYDRSRDIEEVINNMNFNDQKNYFWLNSEERIGPVITKTLPAPILQTGSGAIRPTAGSWPVGRLLQPAALLRWGIIVIEPSAHGQADYAGIISMIKSCGSEMGMAVAQPVVQQFYLNFQDLPEMLAECKQNKVQILFVVLPGSERDYYHKVKQLAERKVGILTQCIKEQTARKGMNPQIIKSILLKVNSKLAGVNQALDTRSMPSCLQGGERVMVVGGHVTHPSPEQLSLYQSSVPSIAAVTASFDPQCTKYNVTMSVQAAETEEITDLEAMMVEHLMVYSRHNRALPTTIIYYRNRTPTTLYDEVESHELSALYAAYWRTARPSQPHYDPTTCPKILFMVVESPRNARLETLDWGPTWNNQKTTRPGLVVNDHGDPIDTVRQMNFRMVSHQAGSEARLSNYFIFFNDGVPYVELERLSYYLCHVSGRGSRSVSCPTPLYYARLACRRALSLTFGQKYNPARLEMGPLRLPVHKDLLQYGRMFFV